MVCDFFGVVLQVGLPLAGLCLQICPTFNEKQMIHKEYILVLCSTAGRLAV